MSSYFSAFRAPPAIDLALLSGAITIPANIDSLYASLFNQQRYLQGAVNWSIELDSGVLLDGLISNPLRSSGSAFAHAAGITGKTAIIAVSDDQFIAGLDEFTASNVDVVNNWEGLDPNARPPTGHGTIVSAVALGESSDFIGTAPDASLIFGSYETNGKLAEVGNAAQAAGAVAWNNSWGFSELFLNTEDFNLVLGGSQENRDYLAALDLYAAQGVVVFAASNDDTLRNATLMDGLPFIRPTLEAGWIAAVNGVPTLSDQNDVTAVQLLSSACYEAARWCLVADGAWQIPDQSVQLPGTATLVTGSSFAAPQISGALAILQEAFGQGSNGLTPHQLRVRLLAAADDDFAGFIADDTVELADGLNKPYSILYGHGFLDIEAALKPIGGVVAPLQNGAEVAVDAPVLLTGSGFGDAVELSLVDTNVAVRDALSAGFVMPGTALTAGARPGSQAGTLLAKAFRRDLAIDRIAAPTALDDPFAAFTGPVLTLSAPDGTAAATVLVPQGNGALGVTLTRALTDGPTTVELGLKLARDDGGLLSLGGEDGAAMASVALGVTQDLGNGAFMALSGEMGLTDLGGDTALGDASSARFDAVKLTAGQSDIFTKGDRLSVGLGMPIAVAQGETVLDLPVSRAGLAAGFESVALDLAPENRQLDLELTYQTALADGVEMQLSLIHSDNFGNRAGETDTAGVLAFALRF